MAKSKKRSVDVRSKKDVGDFEKMLSLGPITLVLVYADWCGHCQHFKKDIWNDLQNMPNKKINLASVHYDQLPNTSQRDAKINGYPSLLVIGNDKKPASFKVEGENEVTNALPDSRNKEMLETMVTSDPNTLPEVLNANTTVAEPVTLTNTMEPIANVAEPLTNTMEPIENVIEQTTLNFQPETLTKRNAVNNTFTPPNVSLDRIPNNSMNTISTMTKSEQKGGSLLDTLIKLAQVTAPAALLTGAAVLRTKCKSRKNKGKKSKKRTTRRR